MAYGPTGYTIYGASWQQLFSVVSQETIPSGIAFNNDGSKMFISGSGTDRVHEYALSTDFDISTASFTQYFSVSAQDTSPTGVSFNADGTKMFVVGSTNDRVYEYNLGTGFDISTAGFSQHFSVSAQEPNPHDVRFNSSGTKMFVVGTTNDRVNEYNLGTGFDVSTASFSQYFSVGAQDATPVGLAFSQNGDKMFVIGATNDDVFSYELSNNFDVSSAVYSDSLDVSFEEASGQAITFDADGSKLFVLGSIGDDVNEYGTGTNGFSERDLNDGSVNGKINISLSGDTFKDIDADNILDIGTEVTVNNIPSGLTPAIALTAGDTVATLTLNGYATDHLNSDDVTDITFEFKNAAFTGGNAGSVTNATGPASSGYGIDFDDSTLVNTTRVSLSSSGVQGSDFSDMPAISDDGRYVAFVSYASNLVSGDSNFYPDVFVRDTQTNTTTRVSVATGGTQTGGNISAIAISGDGRYVAFSSDANNVVAGDTNGIYDVFLHDRDTNTTTRVSVDSAGNQSDGNTSDYAAISDDGRYVTFYSDATNLVADDLNGITDLFLHDTQTGTTSRVSMDENGGEANGQTYYSAISGDGRYIAFSSYANLVSEDGNVAEDVYLYDAQLDVLKLVSKNSVGDAGNGSSSQPSISSDGRYVSYNSSALNLVAGDTNGHNDAFLYDNNTDTTTLVSVDSSGVQSDGFSYSGSVSDDGRFVAFASDGTNLIASDTNLTTDIFLRDTEKNKTYRISTSTDGIQTDDASYIAYPFAISGDGKKVAYASYATNLVTQDINTYADIFLATLGIYDLEFTAGSNGSVSGDTSQTVVHGEDGTAVTATADSGYHFVDWSDGSTDNPRTNLNVLGDITVTANFEADAVDDPNPEAGNDSDGSSSSSGSSNASESGTASSNAAASSTPTEDSDSIPNKLEDAAPNNGDGNGDGIKDSLQNNVASFLNKLTNSYSVLEAPSHCNISSVFMKGEADNEKQDGKATYPFGLMNFTIKCNGPCNDAPIIQYYYSDSKLDGNLVMKKYFSSSHKYQNIPSAKISQTKVASANVIKAQYSISDGGPFDEDGIVNQVIVDPAGLAREDGDAEATTSEEIGKPTSINYLPYILSAIAVATVIVYMYRRRTKTKN